MTAKPLSFNSPFCKVVKLRFLRPREFCATSNDEGSRNSFVCNLRVNCLQECAIFDALESFGGEPLWCDCITHGKRREKCQRLISQCIHIRVFHSLAAKLIKVRVVKEHNLLASLRSPRTLSKCVEDYVVLLSGLRAREIIFTWCSLLSIRWNKKKNSLKEFAKRLRKIISQSLLL